MKVVKIDLAGPGIRFKLTAQSGRRETIRQTTLDFLRQERAQVAVNAHFYLPFGTPEIYANLAGLAVSEGVVYSSFEGQPIAADLADQSYAILSYAPALNIDRSNRASIVHRGRTGAVAKIVEEEVELWTAVSGSAQIVTDGVKTIPTYSGTPFGLNSTVLYSNRNSWYDYLEARTGIGLTRDGRFLVIFTVDQGDESGGMKVGEMADLLIKDYRIWNALNLDGDGSTTLAMADPATGVAHLVNVPDDGAVEGRAVGSSLAVFARPRSDSSPALTISLGLKNRVALSWPASAATWKLQENATLDSEAWAESGAKVRRAGSQMQATLPSIGETRFYRLIKDSGQTTEK